MAKCNLGKVNPKTMLVSSFLSHARGGLMALARASDRVRQKMENSAAFQGKLCGKKGLLCGKLCDFFKADLTLFF